MAVIGVVRGISMNHNDKMDVLNMIVGAVLVVFGAALVVLMLG